METFSVTALATPSRGEEHEVFASLFADIVRLHANQLLEQFMRREADAATHCGCEATLRMALGDTVGEIDAETAWDPSFGALHAGIVGSQPLTSDRAAAVGLRLAERGRAATWSAHISDGVLLRFDRWPLPPCRHLEVSASPGEVRVTTEGSGGRRHDGFVRHGTRWQCLTGLPGLPEVHAAGTRAIVLRRRDLWSPEVADMTEYVDDSGQEQMSRNTTAALVHLETYAAEFSSWVARAVTFVAPWRVDTDQRPTGSSSCAFAPGLVGVGNHDHAPSLAESLVHEASHHYYYVMLRLGAPHDGTDDALYENPFFGRRRPIDRILLAYHAFTNVLELCRVAVAAGENRYFPDRQAVVAEGLALMESTLDRTRALTPLGRTIFERLREAVHNDDISRHRTATRPHRIPDTT